jgi:hypothetical protein
MIAPQSALALDERPGPQLFAVDREHIEGDEGRPVATEQQPIEQRPSAGPTHDLAVQHRGMRADRVRNFDLQLRECLQTWRRRDSNVQ